MSAGKNIPRSLPNRKVLTWCFFLVSSIAGAQSMNVHFRAEQSVKGAGYEAGIGYEGKSRFAVGAFYQVKGIPGQENARGWSDDFYGVCLQAPIVREQKLMLSGVLRAGLVNQNFFVVTPAIETRMMVFKRTGLTIGAGFRHGYPSGSCSLLYMLPISKSRR